MTSFARSSDAISQRRSIEFRALQKKVPEEKVSFCLNAPRYRIEENLSPTLESRWGKVREATLRGRQSPEREERSVRRPGPGFRESPQRRTADSFAPRSLERGRRACREQDRSEASRHRSAWLNDPKIRPAWLYRGLRHRTRRLVCRRSSPSVLAMSMNCSKT